MVYVDKSYAMTSTWKPGAQFLLTINYMQANPDFNNIMYTNLRTMTSLALSNVYVAKIKFIIFINRYTAKFTKWHKPYLHGRIRYNVRDFTRLTYRALAFIDICAKQMSVL